MGIFTAGCYRGYKDRHKAVIVVFVEEVLCNKLFQDR